MRHLVPVTVGPGQEQESQRNGQGADQKRSPAEGAPTVLFAAVAWFGLAVTHAWNRIYWKREGKSNWRPTGGGGFGVNRFLDDSFHFGVPCLTYNEGEKQHETR